MYGHASVESAIRLAADSYFKSIGDIQITLRICVGEPSVRELE